MEWSTLYVPMYFALHCVSTALWLKWTKVTLCETLLLFLLSVINSFDSDPGVLCLILAFMKQ